MNLAGRMKRLLHSVSLPKFTTMKRLKLTRVPVDPALARYDNVTLFPEKVAQAKAMLARTNMDKLYELVAKAQQEAAK